MDIETYETIEQNGARRVISSCDDQTRYSRITEEYALQAYQDGD